MLKDTDKQYISLIFDTLIEQGVETVVSSPGSRNVPLLIATCCREKKLKHHIITDERTASFTALGIAMGSGKPVAICCTSGTALLNYAPAVAEAYYQGIPLIVISADRPIEWIDQDDSQTIRQNNILSHIVKHSYDIPVVGNENKNLMWFTRRSVADAVTNAVSHKKGPVHINVQIDAPLGGEKPFEENYDLSGKKSAIRFIGNEAYLNPGDLETLAEEAKGKKILIICGFMPPSSAMNDALRILATFPNIYIMAETISNVHLPSVPYSIDSTLCTLNKEDLASLVPDIVISTGGSLISRMVKEFLRNNPPAEHWSVGYNDTLVDCFKCLTKSIYADPAIFMRGFAAYLSKPRHEINPEEIGIEDGISYQQRWEDKKRNALCKLDSCLDSIGWSEMKAFDIILKSIPSSANLFFANGTPIRYSQLLTRKIPHACFSNRGVSGIEGTTATALGCSLSYSGPTILITGDMAFSYDTGVLGLKEFAERFKIIVINNHGGGIFRFISSTKHLSNRESLFSSNPSVPVEGLAKAYGIEYFRAESEDQLSDALEKFLNMDNSAILEIISPEEYSAEILHSLLSN